MYMDDMKLLGKHKKRIGESETTNRNIKPVNRNVIRYRKGCETHYEKWKKTNNGRNKTSQYRKNQNA